MGLARVCIPTSIHMMMKLNYLFPPPYPHLNSAKNEKKRRASPSRDTMTLPAPEFARCQEYESASTSLSPFSTSCFFDIISVHYCNVYEFHDDHHIIKSVSIRYSCAEIMQ